MNNQQKRFSIVIAGRPNVGKSTLFNRLIRKRKALVHNEPGVTRDRLIEDVKWHSKWGPIPIRLVDTGGLFGERFTKEIQQQVMQGLAEANLILLIFDSQTGLMSQDSEVCLFLKKSAQEKKIPIWGVINKVDVEKHMDRAGDFYETGLDQYFPVSAEHAIGTDELMDAVCELAHDSSSPGFDANEETEKPQDAHDSTRICIVGKPNVGKSTLMNTILGEERMVTSPIAGTTVDAVENAVKWGGDSYLVVDTAGIRRKNKTEKGMETLSIVQARKALERSELAILLLDGEKGIADQDEKIAGLIEEYGCSVILCVNKWDTQSRNRQFTKKEASERIRDQMPFLAYAPILFVSAMKKTGMDQIPKMIREVIQQRKFRIPTRELTELLCSQLLRNNPRNAKLYLAQQIGHSPPSFVGHVNDPEKIHFSLKRNLIHAIRDRWGYMGSPIRLSFSPGKKN